MFRKFLLFTFIFLSAVVAQTFFAKNKVEAQGNISGYGAQCVGTGIGQYSASVIKNTSGLRHIKFLTPAFNLTDPTNASLVEAFKASLAQEGLSLESFDYLAGNAYNMIDGGGTISTFVGSFYDIANTSKPIVLTETGWFTVNDRYSATSEDYAKAKEELEQLGDLLHAGVYFSPYPGLSNSQFTKHNYLGSNFGDDLCPNGNCSKTGANPGIPNPTDQALYSRMSSDGLGYVLGLAAGTSAEAHVGPNGFVTKAHDNGLTPIIRFGDAVSGGGGFEPQLRNGKLYAETMIKFVKDLDALVDKDVYVILGPNEPMTECWATPNCKGCGAYNNDITADEYSCNIDDDPVEKILQVQGRVSQGTWTDIQNPNPNGKKIAKTGLGIRNVVVTNYSGDPCTVSKLGGKDKGGQLVNIDYQRVPHVTTSSDGYYEMPLAQTKYIKDRFIAFSCNGNISDLYKCDLTKDTDGVINLDIDLNCSGTYRSSDKQGKNVRPYIDLIPKSPGENIPLSNMNQFTACVDDYTSRPQVREAAEQPVVDREGGVIQFQSKTDEDLSYLPPLVNPDPDCDPANPGSGYGSCMPKVDNPLNEEFSSFTTLTHAGKPQYDALANELYTACGNLFQQTKPSFDGGTSPTSKGKYERQLPTLKYWEAIKKIEGSDKKDALGPLPLNYNDLGFVQKLGMMPSDFKKQIKIMDPDMPFAYDDNGEPVLLGNVKVPGYKGKTLFELQNRAGDATGEPLDEKYFPTSCFTEVANSSRTVSPLSGVSGNDDDSAVINIGTGDNNADDGSTCSDPLKCARDFPIGGSMPDVVGDTTGKNSYLEAHKIVRTPLDGDKTVGCLYRGGKGCANPDDGGFYNLLTLPGSDFTKIKETEYGPIPAANYTRLGDGECKKIGFPIVNYCVCNTFEYGEGFCPNPLNKVVVPNEGEDEFMLEILKGQLVAGSILLNNGNDPVAFYSRPHEPFGGIGRFVDAVLSLGYAIFHGGAKNDGSGLNNDACITYDWSNWKDGFCPGHGANATNITVRCTPEGTNVEKDCPCENSCKFSSKPDGGPPYTDCDSAQRLSCVGTRMEGVICQHQIQDGPPKEWGANHPDCKGDITGTIEQIFEYSDRKDDNRLYVTDSLSLPGEAQNSCSRGGTVVSVQANYEVVDKTTLNYTSDIESGQYGACVGQKNLYRISDIPLHGDVISGDAVIGSVVTPSNSCNAFNIVGPDGPLEINFEESLTRALNTLNRDAGEPTSVLVNRYGPWCLTEAYGPKSTPFGYNLMKFIDDYAPSVAARKCEGASNLPPRGPRDGDTAIACSAFGEHSAPGDPYFDYYRGVLNNDKCPLKTNRWPSGLTEQEVLESVKNANMPQGLVPMNDSTTNAKLYELRQQQLPLVIQKAKQMNINPYLIIGIWGTESGWSNRPSCYNSQNP